MAELLLPADEAALEITAACRFFGSESGSKPLALISSKEVGFKRKGKLVRLPRDQSVKPSQFNEGQAFYRGSGYAARTMGLPNRSAMNFGLNVQADADDYVVIGEYGVLRCPDRRKP